MIAALYARVSKDDKHQHTENQLPDMLAFAQRHGWETVEYLENASGKTGGRRPVLARLMKDAQQKKVDVVISWKIDRFGRSLTDFVNNVRALDAAGVRFVAPSQGIDTDQKAPFAKFQMHLLAMFAEFERDLIIERVNAGINAYRVAYELGRVGKDKQRQSKSRENKPHGRPKTIFRRDVAAEMIAKGMSLRAVARELGVDRATLRRGMRTPK